MVTLCPNWVLAKPPSIETISILGMVCPDQKGNARQWATAKLDLE
jgi:hypothetical protein